MLQLYLLASFPGHRMSVVRSHLRGFDLDERSGVLHRIRDLVDNHDDYRILFPNFRFSEER